MGAQFLAKKSQPTKVSLDRVGSGQRGGRVRWGQMALDLPAVWWLCNKFGSLPQCTDQCAALIAAIAVFSVCFLAVLSIFLCFLSFFQHILSPSLYPCTCFLHFAVHFDLPF